MSQWSLVLSIVVMSIQVTSGQLSHINPYNNCCLWPAKETDRALNYSIKQTVKDTHRMLTEVEPQVYDIDTGKNTELRSNYNSICFSTG